MGFKMMSNKARLKDMVISNRKKIRLKGNMTTAFKYMKFYVAEVISVLLQKAE